MENRDSYEKNKLYQVQADKIFQKIEELEKSGKENEYKKRWLWELTQNAKDSACSNKKIKITIKKTNEGIMFTHNGEPFNERNLKDLILQASSKRSDNNKTGKFGTGFISTHFISKKIKITGDYMRGNQLIKNGLDVTVDRNFTDIDELTNKLKNSINEVDSLEESFSESDDSFSISDFSDIDFITSFLYTIKYEDDKIVNDSIKEFYKIAPFVLTFNENIEEFTVDNKKISICERSRVSEEIESVIIDNGGKKTLLLLMDKEGVSIAIRIENNACVNMEDFPKLFCDFPLIGTEKFSFPVIINSSKFEVKQERDGLLPVSEVNKNIFNIAIELYDQLLGFLSYKKVNSIYNCCELEWNHDELQKSINERVRCKFKHKKIVSLANGGYGQLKIDDKIIPIPYVSEDDFELWDIVYKLYKHIPNKDDNKRWLKVCPENRWTIKNFVFMFQQQPKSFFSYFSTDKKERGEDEVQLVNRFYACWIKYEGKEDFIKNAPLLRQDGSFTSLDIDNKYLNNKGNHEVIFINTGNNELIFDDSIDEGLKDLYDIFIYEPENKTIRSVLIDKRITIEKNIVKNSWNSKSLATDISSKVRELLGKEKSSGDEREESLQSKFNKLTDWFRNNKILAKELFGDIYENSYQLTSSEEINERLNNGDKFAELIMETGKSPEEIRKIISGFDGNELISENFMHETVHDRYSRYKYEELRKRSIENVYKKIKSNCNYTISEEVSEWLSSTDNIFYVKKKINDEDVDIRIIVRPADDNKIIFYEQVELEAMDELAYELWIDDGNEMVKAISLAELIVMTGINMIPLDKIIKENIYGS